MEIHKGRGYVYSIQYHIVWCVKYRHKLLTGEVEQRLKEMLVELAKNHGYNILAMECKLDHVYLLLDCSPQHYIPDIIKTLKGNTTRFLFVEYPDLKKRVWKGHLWNPSYFVSTVSENTESQIKRYIESQKAGGTHGKSL